MKKKPDSKSAFFNQRVLIGFSFCLLGLVLALLAFAAVPGGNALAREKQQAPRQQTGVPVKSSSLVPAADIQAQSEQEPLASNLLNLLYDQSGNPSTTVVRSQNYDAGHSSFELQSADDFVVPANQTWTIHQLSVQGKYLNGSDRAASVNVTFYSDSAGSPGGAVSGGTYSNVPVADKAGNFTISLPTGLALSTGTYWVSVRANMDFNKGGQWGWLDRTVQSNSAAVWQNSGGDSASPCANGWGAKTGCVAGAAPDNIFQLRGTLTPAAILYDQNNNLASTASSSQNFEAANDAFDDQVADDFVVPAGQTWTINQVNIAGQYFNGAGPAASFNVFFYANSGGLPAVAATYTANTLAYTSAAGVFSIPLTTNAVLPAGTYWLSVQANQDFTPSGQFGWTDRTVTSNSPAAFRNPGAGFACTGGNGWVVKTTCITTTSPDQGFQILGTSGAPSPTPTPTVTPVGATPTPTPSATATPSVTATPAANFYFSGDLTAADPDFVNPGGSTVGTGRQRYDVFQFTVATTGPHTFEISSRNTAAAGSPSNALDTYYRLYATTFNPAAPGAGLTSNDDFTGALTVLPGPFTVNGVTATATGFSGLQPSSRMPTVALTAGTQYFLIMTSFRSTDYVPTTGGEAGPTGPYWGGISPGDIIPTGVITPTPSATVTPVGPTPTASPSATRTPTPTPTASASASTTPCGGTVTFTNAGAITIPDSGNGVPYPSTIAVSGVGVIPATVGAVKVTINGFSHTFPSDVGFVLVGPTGAALNIQDGADDSAPMANVIYTLADTGAGQLPESAAWGPGTYKPTDFFGDTYPAPGPGTTYGHPGPAGGGTATFASIFGGTNANGNWNLYVEDFVGGDSGSVSGGWTISFTTGAGCPSATPSASVSPGTPTPTPSVTAAPSGTPSPSATASPGGCALINGGLNPQPLTESGVAAPAGTFWSEVQHDAGNNTVANTNAGYAATQELGTRLADNFTLTQACTINNIVFYSYLTGAPATPSPFTAYTLQIWNGRPGDAGAAVVFGDTTTNRLVSSTDSTFFRIFNTVVPPPGTAQGTTRKIWRNTVNVGGLALPAGTYWVDWASSVTGGVNHFDPAKTIQGARGAAGDNARQFTAGAWVDVTDVGTPATGTPVPQDFPFEVNGLPAGGTPPPSPSPGTPTPTPSASASPCGATTTFTNPASITLPDCPTGCAAPQPASLYPSNITVAGVSGAVSKVTVTIVGWNHTFPGDNDFLLVGPGGQKFIVLSDALTTADTTGQTYTFDDTAAALMPSAPATAPASGSFKPSNYTTGDTFPAPAPAAPYLSPATAGTDLLAAFNGVDPNGVWSLYIVDDANIDSGNITGGWSLAITTTASCTTPTPTPTATPTSTVPLPTPTVTPPLITPTPSATVPVGTPTATPTATATATGTAGPSATPGITPQTQAVNFSTRMRVQTGDRVGIGGFIITGAPKQVLVRAIGPSLTRFMIVDALADPLLELHGPAGFTTQTNDNWRVPNGAAIQATGLPPTNDLESAILVTLNPGAYTAIVKGNGGTSGVALVEVYDLNPSSGNLANISTRAFVDTGDNVVIAGFVLDGGSANGTDGSSAPDSLIIRGIGPSLTAAGVSSVLADPTLELRDSNGTLLIANNDWHDNPGQAAIITAAGLAPSNNLESAIAATLPPGLYTALLAGLNNTTGNGLVEVYDRGAAGGVPGPTPTPGPSTTPGGTPAPSATPGGTPVPTPPTSPTPPAATPTPSPAGNCTESFDGVAAPALPAGWVNTVVVGDAPGWITSTTSPDSGANDLFVIDQNGVSDKTVDSRDITVSSAAAELSFRNFFQTEYDPPVPGPEHFWDGYVLEVSVNGGAFGDLVGDAGGVFVTGGYIGEIDGTAGNPLAGRPAWCGTSGGVVGAPVYIDTKITLPASMNGQSIKLRFRMGTDEAQEAPGVRVDSLTITGASCP